MVVIFPFEEKIYRDAGVPVDFVGHPLVDVVRPTMNREEFAALHGIDPARPIVTLLPGSRRNEIAQQLSCRILEACELLARDMKPGRRPIRSRGSTRARMQLIRPVALARAEHQAIEGAAYDALAAADCAIVASGTATVEAALSGTPMVVIYRVAKRRPRSFGDDPHSLFRHGQSDRRKPSGARTDSGRFHALPSTAEVRHLLESLDARDEMKTDSPRSAPTRAPAAPSSEPPTFSPGCCKSI